MNHPSVLPRCTPEHQGISSDIISRFLDRIHEQGIELHSFMALRGGYIIAEGWWEPYREDHPHMMFSLSKSFIPQRLDSPYMKVFCLWTIRLFHSSQKNYRIQSASTLKR